MAANKPFKHQPLNLDRTQIRLFRLIPTERSGDLAGIITTYDFENCPEYRAVSYTWGPPDPTREISLEGQGLTIRENLWQFLDVARDLAEDWLWIDQVCIDQSVVDERNHQVSLMAMIYANAFEVLLWLGAEADGSGEAMEAINSGAGSMSQYESEVQSLFRRPYWNRLWILQEILMAQNISVICGDQVFAWETLESRFIPQIPRGIEINISWEEHPVEIDKVALSLIEERASFGGANQRLSYVLENFASLQCGDVRDKVYGLLSLVRRSGVIPVDYTITEDNVFFNALRKIVEDESYIETENHFFVGRHLRDTMMLVHISDAEIFVCIKKERQEIRKADSKDKPDQTLLDWAVNNGNESMVKVLLEDGADINAADEDRETPLYQASSEGHVEVIKLLLKKGADIQIANIWGETPLHQAQKVEIVKLLLEKGADIQIANIWGDTPLHQASSMGKAEIIKLLLEKGADIQIANMWGETPLHQARKVEIVKLLLEKGADNKVADIKGFTPLHWASKRGKVGIVKLLLEKGADINAANKDRETPLHQASSIGKVEIVKLLLEKGADINAANKDRETPLHQASDMGKAKIIKLLLEKGADINVVDLHGRTPLYWASDNGLPNVVKLLHEKGADINVDRRRKHGLEPEDKYLEPL